MSTFSLGLIIVEIALLVGLLYFAFSGPSSSRAVSRRLEQMRERHSASSEIAAQVQLKRILAHRGETRMDGFANRFIPKPALLRRRIQQTGKDWTLGQYLMASVGLTVVVAGLLLLRQIPLALALAVGLFVGIGLPHLVIGKLIKRRIAKFNARCPDGIELMVRGLRSGLPISETIGIVAAEIKGPVGIEFQSVTDKMKIGRTMEAALQETADRLGTAEFQFFVITLAIQRETGGNLAETLANLSDVLRKRAQMKLKIRAMSSESKASAYIVGALPFIVFAMVYIIAPEYLGGFFHEQRLMIVGLLAGVGIITTMPRSNLEIDHLGHDEHADGHPHHATQPGNHQPLLVEEATEIFGGDNIDHGEDDEGQRADDIGGSLRFRRHRPDLQLHLRALAKDVGQIGECLGQIAAGFALDGEGDDEELELRRAEPIRCFLQRGFHRAADLHLVGYALELNSDRSFDLGRDDTYCLRNREARAKATNHQIDAVGKACGERGDATLDQLADYQMRQADPDEKTNRHRQGQRHPPEQQQAGDNDRKADRGKHILPQCPVLAGLLDPAAQQSGLRNETLRETIHPGFAAMRENPLELNLRRDLAGGAMSFTHLLQPPRHGSRRRRPGEGEVKEAHQERNFDDDETQRKSGHLDPSRSYPCDGACLMITPPFSPWTSCRPSI